MEDNMYIYQMINKINGKKYIGKTNNPVERKATHFREARKENNKEYNKTLYIAMRKYGIENFIFEIIEECNDLIWEEREKYWISYYNTLKEGYNMIDGGSEPPHPKNEDHPMSKLTWDEVHQIKSLLKLNTILMKDISIGFNIGIDQIYRINTGETWSEDTDTFPIRKNIKLSEEEVNSIIWYLQNTDITQKDIGKLFNRVRTAITAINTGSNYHNPQLDYPLRKGRHYKHK
jgi:group I intron endonuclease